MFLAAATVSQRGGIVLKSVNNNRNSTGKNNGNNSNDSSRKNKNKSNNSTNENPDLQRDLEIRSPRTTWEIIRII